MNVLSLFNGMSGIRVALNRLHIKVDKYYSSEIDKYTIQISQKNWPDMIQLGDVCDWKSWDIDWSGVDLLTGGSPCQGFSLLGKQLAFDDDRSKLVLIYRDILNHIKSVNPDIKFLLENVRMKPEHLDAISDLLSVKPICINSSLVSAQTRTRYYWTNWEIQQPYDLGRTYKDVAPDSKFKPATARKGNPRLVKLTGDKFKCIVASYFKGIRSDGRPALATREGVFDELVKTGDIRILTPLECERLQTFPDNYTEGVSNTQRYKMLGNGLTVNVATHVLRPLFPERFV